MFSSIFSSLFKKNNISLKVPDSILVNRLQEFAKKNSLYLLKEATIFNHTEKLQIPLMLIDAKRGIFLFEYKTWSYRSIKDLKVSKSSREQVSDNTLAFESKHEFIENRFNEVLHCDGPNIHNFVLMEYLSKDEFERLDPSFSELMPQNRILFSSDTFEEIEQKLFDVVNQEESFTIEQNIAALFVQDSVVKNKKIYITSPQEHEIIAHQFVGLNYLSYVHASGATTVILLKALYEYLLNREKNICIVQPTHLACELLQQKLLATAEHGIVDVDFSKIAVVTPDNVNKKKTDIFLIDNASMLDRNFLEEISSLKKDILIFENYDEHRTYRFHLRHNYRAAVATETLYGNPFALTFIHLQRLIDAGINLQEILIVTTDADDKEKISEDLKSFIADIPIIVDPTQSINNQELDHLLIANHDEIFGICRNYVFLFNPKDISDNTTNFLLSRAEKKTFVIYEQKGNSNGKDIQNDGSMETTALA